MSWAFHFLKIDPGIEQFKQKNNSEVFEISARVINLVFRTILKQLAKSMLFCVSYFFYFKD